MCVSVLVLDYSGGPVLQELTTMQDVADILGGREFVLFREAAFNDFSLCLCPVDVARSFQERGWNGRRNPIFGWEVWREDDE
jgi:hypothetical protein